MKLINIGIILLFIFILSYVYTSNRSNKNYTSENVDSDSFINTTSTCTSSSNKSSIEHFEINASTDINSINGLYARYQAKDYSPVTNSWTDSSPNKRDLYSPQIVNTDLIITTNNGHNGATENFPIIRGTPNTQIYFTNAVINAYTLIYICRYNGNGGNRILNGNVGNWLSGFHGDRSGVAYHEGWISNGKSIHSNNWVIGVDSGNLYRSNGVTRGTTGGSITSLPPFGINGNGGVAAGEKSNFEIAELMIFNKVLTVDEYTAVENSLSQIYGISFNASVDSAIKSSISSKFITLQGVPIEGLYARYQAKDYVLATNSWLDSSPNKLDIPSSQITNADLIIKSNDGKNGATENFPVINGTLNTQIDFTTAEIKDYTLIYICRHSGSNRSRILNGKAGNWLSGFWGGKSGLAYHEGWVGDPNNDIHGVNWVIGVDSGNLYRSNGITRGTTGGSRTSLPPFGINSNGGSYPNEKSDFEIAELMIFNRVLTPDEYTAIETSLSQTYGIRLINAAEQAAIEAAAREAVEKAAASLRNIFKKVLPSEQQGQQQAQNAFGSIKNAFGSIQNAFKL
jgi:hypothetical protein